MLTWQKMGNMLRARAAFEKLITIAPDHPAVAAFEAQIGQKLGAAPAEEPVIPAPSRAPAKASVPAPAPKAMTPAPAPVQAAPEPEVHEAPPESCARRSSPDVAVDAEVSVEAGEAGDDLELKIIELREQAQKQEASKRFNEYVKTLVALAEIVPDVAEKVDLNLKAADLYVSKFANQAEAIKAYERVLDADPENQQAVNFLLQMYEKRRDWEEPDPAAPPRG